MEEVSMVLRWLREAAMGIRLRNIKGAELREFAGEQLKALADRPGIGPEHRRNLLRRALVQWLDDRIEGGKIKELLSDIAIRLVVGLIINLVDDAADKAIGFLEDGEAPPPPAEEPEPEPPKPTRRRRKKAEEEEEETT